MSRQLVVLENTTFLGTVEEALSAMFARRDYRFGENSSPVSLPQRIRSSDPTYKATEIAKLIGGIMPVCTRTAALLFRRQ